MDEQLKSLIARVQQAQNVLVTVSTNPTVDQLAAAIGLTLALNKLDKHGTAVFSGEVPSTIEFLKPEETLEKNTNSLRDFIIALDKSKADKLRYKVEDEVVRIFITPYRTSLSQNDLQFSQGDFNVDVVIALGVGTQQDLDSAITAHGRILHDATVAAISTQAGELGTINWIDGMASSLSEMTLTLIDGFDKKLLDNQIATALLTGIVSSTDRFRNERTSPKAMSASAELMAAGANQQLIATELEPAVQIQAPAAVASPDKEYGTPAPAAEKKPEPGTLEIDHEAQEKPAPPVLPEASSDPDQRHPQVHVDENGELHEVTDEQGTPAISAVRGVGVDGTPSESDSDGEVRRERMVGPPSLGNVDITANTNPESLDPSTEELTKPPQDAPILSHTESVLTPPPVEAEELALPPLPPIVEQPEPVTQPLPPPPPPVPMPEPLIPAPAPPVFEPPAPTPPEIVPGETLAEIEESVDSLHLQQPPAQDAQDDLDSARNAVEEALSRGGADALDPITALNAQPLGSELQPPSAAPAPVNTGFNEPTPGSSPADETLDMPLPPPPAGAFPGVPAAPTTPPGTLPPPPVPPPMLPPLQ